jgi:hypothetical protein
MNRIIMTAAAACLLLAAGAFAQSKQRVTVVGANAPAGSNVTEKLLEECIVSLPPIKELEADVSTRSEYLKEINGEAGRNEHVKVYTATVTVSYQVREKVLIIVTTSSVEGQEPVVREEVRTVMRQTKPFESDIEGGDIFAGRSNRRYYYSSADKAAENAKKRAEVWIRQQQQVVCAK